MAAPAPPSDDDVRSITQKCSDPDDFCETNDYIAFVLPFVLPSNSLLPQLNRIRNTRVVDSAWCHELTYPLLDADGTVVLVRRELFSLGNFNREWDMRRCDGKTVVFIRKLLPGMWDGLFVETIQIYEPVDPAARPTYLFIGLPSEQGDLDNMTRQRDAFAHHAAATQVSRVFDQWICTSRRELTQRFAAISTPPTVIVICAHGTDDGKCVQISDDSGGKEMVDCRYFEELFRAVLKKSPQFRAVIFLSCYIGQDGGLVQELAKCCPVTTLSFAQAVYKEHTVINYLTEFVEILLRVWLGYYASEASVVTEMQRRGGTGPLHAGMHVRLLITAWSLYNERSNLPSSFPELLAHPIQCRPWLRNPRGYLDPKWWPIQRVIDWWKTGLDEINELFVSRDISSAFYNTRFEDLPGRVYNMPMVMVREQSDRVIHMVID